jgi:hypothetical protein
MDATLLLSAFIRITKEENLRGQRRYFAEWLNREDSLPL